MGFPIKVFLGDRDRIFLSQLQKVEDLKIKVEEVDNKSTLVDRSLIENFCVPLVIAHCQLAILRRLSQQPENQRNYQVIHQLLCNAVPKVIKKSLGNWVALNDPNDSQPQGQENRSIEQVLQETLDLSLSTSDDRYPPRQTLDETEKGSVRKEEAFLRFKEPEPREEDLELAFAHAKKEIDRLTFRRKGAPLSIGLIWSIGSVKKENLPSKEEKKDEKIDPIEEEITPSMNLVEKSQALTKAIQERGAKVPAIKRDKQALIKQLQDLAERLSAAEKKLKETPHSNIFRAAIFRNKVTVLTPMKNRLIAGLENGALCFFNPFSIENAQVLAGQNLRPITALAIDNLGERLASGNDQGLVSIWNIQDKRRFQSFSRPPGIVTLLKFMQYLGEEVMAVGTNVGRLFFWDMNAGIPLVEFKSSIRIDAFILSQLKSEVLACDSFNNSIFIWKLTQDSNSPKLALEKNQPRTELPVFPVNKKSDNDCALVPSREIAWPEKIEKKLLSSTTIKAHLLVLIGDRSAAAGCSDGKLRIWNFETNEELQCIEGAKPILGLSFLKKENKLVALYEGGIIRVFEEKEKTWKEFAQIDLGVDSKLSLQEDKQFFSTFTFFDEGKKLAMRYMDQTILIWDLEEILKSQSLKP